MLYYLLQQNKSPPLEQFVVQRQWKTDIDDGKIVDGKTTKHSDQSIHVVRLKWLTAVTQTKHR